MSFPVSPACFHRAFGFGFFDLLTGIIPTSFIGEYPIALTLSLSHEARTLLLHSSPEYSF